MENRSQHNYRVIKIRSIGQYAIDVPNVQTPLSVTEAKYSEFWVIIVRTNITRPNAATDIMRFRKCVSIK